MDALRQLVVLCVCGAALSEPLGEALRRYSRHGVYAGEYSRGYSPYMYAAVPLHAPLPVLRVLSPAPLAPRDPLLAPSAHSPVYARAPYADDHDDYDEPQQYAAYAHRYQTPQLYAAESSAADESTVLYARPTAYGGYTYRSAPHKPAGKRAPADLPYIVRVHKYRIVKER